MSKNSKQDHVRAGSRDKQRGWLAVLDFGIPSQVGGSALSERSGRPAASGFVTMP